MAIGFHLSLLRGLLYVCAWKYAASAQGSRITNYAQIMRNSKHVCVPWSSYHRPSDAFRKLRIHQQGRGSLRPCTGGQCEMVLFWAMRVRWLLVRALAHPA